MAVVHSTSPAKPERLRSTGTGEASVATPNRAARLQAAAAQEGWTDPFLLAREYVNQCERDDAGQLTLRYWRGEWLRYGACRYVRIDESAIRVDVTGFVKCYYDENGAVDRFGNALKVGKGHISNVLHALTAVVAVGDDLEPPVWLGPG